MPSKDKRSTPTRPPDDRTAEEPVMVFDPISEEQAEVILATLRAAGIHAFVDNPNASAGVGMIGEQVTDTWRNRVYVAAADAEAARALLTAREPGEAELTAEEEADPTTLAEAEARTKRATP